ncbi:MAG TPA: hypothetical protein VK395_02705 [Gemmataceae bacterium]|nr:hypothetical protein [Gemmataceae bacterium]
MRGILAGSFVLLLALSMGAADAQEPPRATVTALSDEIPVDNSPVVTLGRPVAIDAPPIPDQTVRPVSYNDPVPLSSPGVVQVRGGDGPPAGGVQAPPPGAPILPPSPNEQYNCGVATQNPAPQSWWDKTKEFCGGFPWFGKGNGLDSNPNHHLFESDHSFDGFISPVTNPFYFEDPRSLTELRPIFMYEATPIKNAIFHGGDIEFVGLQARLAITDQFSFVINELGLIWSEPNDPVGDFQTHSGFTELKLGPKFTFYRNESSGTVAAGGLTFDIPVGDHNVLQDTGDLSLVPYLSVAQRIIRTPYGTLNGMGTLGYNFSIDNQRSDNIFLSLHTDFDVGDLHRIYPLLELNSFYYTSNGKQEDVGFEGADLFNFGSEHVSGKGEVSLALGARFKINDRIQFGAAFETPLTSHRDLQDFRITMDLIFRY